MALKLANVNLVLSWQQQMPISGYQPRKQGLDSHSANLQGLDLTLWNQLYTAIIDVETDETIDLTTLTNLVGESFSFGKVNCLFVTAFGGRARIEPGDSNGIEWIGGASDGAELLTGETLVKLCSVADDDGYAVTGSQKNLKLTNLEDTSTEGLRVKVSVLGSTQS